MRWSLSSAGPSLSAGYEPLFFYSHIAHSFAPASPSLSLESNLSVLTQIRCRNCRRKARHSRICNYINRRQERDKEATVSSFFSLSFYFCFIAIVSRSNPRIPSILHKLFITTHSGETHFAKKATKSPFKQKISVKGGARDEETHLANRCKLFCNLPERDGSYGRWEVISSIKEIDCWRNFD